MRVAAIGYATEQGLGRLLRDFTDNGVVDYPIIWPHRSYENHPEWYAQKGAAVAPVQGSLARFIQEQGKFCDVLLAFETFFDWSCLPVCQSLGIKTVLVPMYEWTPRGPLHYPNAVLCPSALDYRYFTGGQPGYGAENWVRLFGSGDLLARVLPIPVYANTWEQKSKACRFLHNSGHVGHRWHKGTLELLKAIPHVRNPDFRITIRTQEKAEFEKVLDEAGVDTVDHRVNYVFGEVPYAELWRDFDVYVAPEKFNGLSLPLQEARAAGLMVMTTNRFPHNAWLPREPLVPVSGYHRACVGSSYLEFDEAEVRPEDIAAKIDELYGTDIGAYSESGRVWAEAHSWNALREKWREALAP